MKNIYISLIILLVSCSEPKYTYIGQEIIDGKVSSIQEGRRGKHTRLPRIWVQSPKETREVLIPFEYENKWKVGDSCFLIIEKYSEK